MNVYQHVSYRGYRPGIFREQLVCGPDHEAKPPKDAAHGDTKPEKPGIGLPCTKQILDRSGNDKCAKQYLFDFCKYSQATMFYGGVLVKIKMGKKIKAE